MHALKVHLSKKIFRKGGNKIKGRLIYYQTSKNITQQKYLL